MDKITQEFRPRRDFFADDIFINAGTTNLIKDVPAFQWSSTSREDQVTIV